MLPVLLLAGSIAVHASSDALDTTHITPIHDTTKRTYVLDSAYLPSLIPDVIVSLGAGSVGGLSGINPIFAARDQVLAGEGFPVQTTRLQDGAVALSGEVLIPINPNVELIGDMDYAGDYSMATAGITVSVPLQNVVLLYFGGQYGLYYYNRTVNYGSNRYESGGGYTVLDNVTYSFSTTGERAIVGLDFAIKNFVGLNLYAAYNKVTPSTDDVTKAIADPTGYEYGIRLSFHFWKANTPREGQ